MNNIQYNFRNKYVLGVVDTHKTASSLHQILKLELHNSFLLQKLHKSGKLQGCYWVVV